MKTTIRIEVPEREALVERLSLGYHASFEHDARAAAIRLEEARTELTGAVQERKRASGAALERALVRERAAALAIEPAETALVLADEALAAAKTRAKHQLLAAAVAEHRRLQKVAAQLAPVLEHLATLEHALDEEVRKVGLPGVHGVDEALEWPACNTHRAMLAIAQAPPLTLQPMFHHNRT